MAWDRERANASDINAGNEYNADDYMTVDQLNSVVNNSLYAVDFAEGLGDTPDTTNVDKVGIPSVELVNNTKTIDGVTKTVKKLKFSNLKGEKGIEGGSIYTTGLELPSPSGSFLVRDITVPLGRIIKEGDLLVSWTGRNNFVRVETIAGTSPTSVGTYSYVGNIRGYDGFSGYSIYTTTAEIPADGYQHTIATALIQTGANPLQMGDLLLSTHENTYGYLGRIVNIVGTDVKCLWVANMRGAKGDTGADGAKGDKGDKGDRGDVETWRPDETIIVGPEISNSTFYLYLASGTISHYYQSNSHARIKITGSGESAVCDWGDGTSEPIDFTGGFVSGNNNYLEVYLGYNMGDAIGENAFKNSQNLMKATIAYGIATIGVSAFENCYNLSQVIMFPNSITTIGHNAFNACIKLESVTMSNIVTSIGNNAFKNCVSLYNISMPDGLTNIGEYAFYNCSAQIKWGLFVGITTIGKNAFRGYRGTSIAIPNSVDTIGEAAFYDCDKLTDIYIPYTVTNIGQSAFGLCYNLGTIRMSHSEMPTFAAYAFVGCKISDIYALNATMADNLATAITTGTGILLNGYRKLY